MKFFAVRALLTRLRKKMREKETEETKERERKGASENERTKEPRKKKTRQSGPERWNTGALGLREDVEKA